MEEWIQMPQTKLVTPIGKAEYAHVHTPDTRFNSDGVWSIALRLPASSDEAKTLMEVMDEGVQEASKQFKEKKVANPPYKEDGDDILFRFKQKSIIRSRAGEEWSTRVNVVDSKLNQIPKSIAVGNGSKVRVSYTLRPYKSINGAGIAADLSGVQVIELIEYNPNQNEFSEADGFTASEIPTNEKENFKVEETEDEDF
jgi:hypothetical protein|tara:strand:+ start:4366 stop:4959 length:594 start_codon:yes stop_codon:yes gene_type:complete